MYKLYVYYSRSSYALLLLLLILSRTHEARLFLPNFIVRAVIKRIRDLGVLGGLVA